MTRQLKVLIVHNSYQQLGGEDIVFEQQCQMLKQRGHPVVTYCRSNWEIEGYSTLARGALVPKVIWNTDARRELSRLLYQQQPDIVHVHNTFLMISPSIYSACQAAQVPVVQTLHNYRLLCPAAIFFRDGRVCEECVEHGLWRAVRHGCYRDSRPATAVVALMLAAHSRFGTWTRMVDCYVSLSEFARSKFVQAGLPADKIFVQGNFVYPDPGAGTVEREYALFAGRLFPEKRALTLLAAWERLHRAIPLLII
jgi:glycosyltransferase involved in cell wall biosynthesis